VRRGALVVLGELIVVIPKKISHQRSEYFLWFTSAIESVYMGYLAHKKPLRRGALVVLGEPPGGKTWAQLFALPDQATP